MNAARYCALALAVLATLSVASCSCDQDAGKETAGAGAGRGDGGKGEAAGPLEGERLARFLEAHQTGLGAMEQYRYSDAVKAFREAVTLAPELTAPKVNLAIALLNDTGERTEAAKDDPGGAVGAEEPAPAMFDEAMSLLDEVLRREPGNLHAHYCRGIIFEYTGQTAEAYREFKLVAERDPGDAHTLLKVGMTMPDPNKPGYPATIEQADQLIEIYGKALERNPYLVSAMYRLQQAYTWGTRKDPSKREEYERKRVELMSMFERMDRNKTPTGTGEMVEQSYGDAGKYALVMDPFDGGRGRERRAPELKAPRIETPMKLGVSLGAGERWVQASDFEGSLAALGRVRSRFGAAVAAADFDRDGKVDLFLCAAVKTEEGVRDVLLRNLGDGKFEDVSMSWGLRGDRASTGVAAGDFDADGFIDVYLTGFGDDRLLRNAGGKAFEDVTESLGERGEPALSLTARWIDLDQDGDLDLYVIRYCPLEEAGAAFTAAPPSKGASNLAYRNDGRPAPLGGNPQSDAPAATDFYGKATQGLSIAWSRWEGDGASVLADGEKRHTGVAALDLDVDRDLDLVILADDEAPVAAINERLGRYRAVELTDAHPRGPVNGASVLDCDKDGRPDLVLINPAGRLAAWRNQEPEAGSAEGFALTFWPIDARRWRAAQVADLDLDGWVDLLGLPDVGEGDAPAPVWARNEGSRLAPLTLALGPDSAAALAGLVYADLAGDALPDLLLLRDGEGPSLGVNRGNGHQWLGIELAGRWKFGKATDGGPARSNPHGIGTRVLLQGPGLDVSFDDVPGSSGLAQSVGSTVLGLGDATQALLVRLTWPDGVMQSELNVQGNQLLVLSESNRKTGSCPVLFTFDGQRMACIGDFLGGGGLGYLVAPGVYGEPDRDEAVAIRGDQLRAVDGEFVLSIVEPMDELAYLDKLTLDVIDLPPGVSAAPDERFAPGGNRPTGALLAWRESIGPQRASDLKGNDVTERLRAFDNITVDTFRKRSHWIGYAEEHGIVLDFGDTLARFGPTERLVLGLAGWVEYPYSQTNYAAATAGIELAPPVLERLQEDGTWAVIEPDPGYPAGLPRLTTLDLTGKLEGPRCVLRIKTNMECYYDHAFIAVLDSEANPRVTELPVAGARLGYRGYLREVSPDGRLPLLYDYAAVDPAPLARLAGKLTRYGDVAPLLRDDDDQFCIVGPGDEVRLTFDAKAVPELPEGWTRSYILRSIGYCKDADPFTAGSDTVGPLPWRGMPAEYPFGARYERPRDAAYERYLREYQTREATR